MLISAEMKDHWNKLIISEYTAVLLCLSGDRMPMQTWGVEEQDNHYKLLIRLHGLGWYMVTLISIS